MLFTIRRRSQVSLFLAPLSLEATPRLPRPLMTAQQRGQRPTLQRQKASGPSQSAKSYWCCATANTMVASQRPLHGLAYAVFPPRASAAPRHCCATATTMVASQRPLQRPRLSSLAFTSWASAARHRGQQLKEHVRACLPLVPMVSSTTKAGQCAAL
jgi:hypothetical protein